MNSSMKSLPASAKPIFKKTSLYIQVTNHSSQEAKICVVTGFQQIGNYQSIEASNEAPPVGSD